MSACRRAQVYAMLGERHEEVVREQMILQDACLGEYPDVAREFEAEVRTRADRQPLAPEV